MPGCSRGATAPRPGAKRPERQSPPARAGQVRRGVLEVLVANSTVMQELSFEKTRLVARLAELVPEEKIRDLKFRVGTID